MSKLREDILFKLTGDSYGEEQYVDNKAKFIADDMQELFKTLILDLIRECRYIYDSNSLESTVTVSELRKKVEEL